MLLQLLKPLSVQYVEIFTNASLIIFNLSLGIHFANTKRIAEHKSAMTWTCTWSAAPGLVRLTFYLLKLTVGRDCRVEQMGFYSWGAAFMAVTFLIPVWCMLREVKTKLFLVNVCAIVFAISGSFLEARQTMLEGEWCW